MVYSAEKAYIDFFKLGAEGKYHTTPVNDRLTAAAWAGGTAVALSLGTACRVIQLINEIAKIIFYSFAALFTLGNHGNKERLGDHCKLFALNSAALIYQPLQALVHSLALFVGIASPKGAYRMMEGAAIPLDWIVSHENEIRHHYQTPEAYEKLKDRIAEVFDQFQWPEHTKFSISNISKYIIYELDDLLEHAQVMPLAHLDKFQLFSANPAKLTKEQKKLVPILLLHGNGSHQATWAPLLHALENNGNQRPVYTLNLPRNCNDTTSIREKIEQIKAQYLDEDGSDAYEEGLNPLCADFHVDLVGHSMGSNLIQELSLDYLKPHETRKDKIWVSPLKFKIRRAIAVGTPFYYGNEEKCKQIVEINGKKDFLISPSVAAKGKGGIEVDTGHCGLISQPDGVSAIIEALA